MRRINPPRVLMLAAISIGAVFPPRAAAVDDVAGTLITLSSTTTAPNGAWSWFQDDRAIIDNSDPNNVRLLVSSASSAANGNPESGDVDLLWVNLNTGQQGEFELANQFERDDHDSAALYIRPDGRYLAMYAKHITDQLTRWRVSTNSHDPTSWGAEQTLNVGAGTTYNNVHYLTNDNGGAGRTYNFTRATNFDPVVQISSNDGSNWSTAGKLLTQGGSNDRPYLKYASNDDKIHFIATEEHPRDFFNSVYHGYVQNGVLYDSEDVVRDASVFDAAGVSPTLLTPVLKNGDQFGGIPMTRAWTIDLELDNTGNPVGIISARANNSTADHRFFYARFDGANWQVNEMAQAGGFLYANESDYTGLTSIDPDNPNVVYMSSDIDPRTETGTTRYEIYKGVTSDFGATWTWSPITENSTMDNLRPVVPQWDGQNTAVAWMRGTYTSYTSWDTELVALALTPGDPQALLWRGNTENPTHWDEGVTSNWDSGGGAADAYADGDEVAFDDTASTFSVDLQGTLSPMGVAFNNVSQPYTLTGGGIAGGGRLRVIGGGSVTLADGNHTYAGDTLIARGTLALVGTAALSETPHIDVRSNGVLDFSAVSGGAYPLDGQELTVAGGVVGNVQATNGSFVRLASANPFAGDLAASDSTVAGTGTITGNLTAETGSVIQVGDAGITVTPILGPVTYVDATSGVSGNTTLSGGGVFSPPLNGTTGADNNWEQRTPLGSSSNIYESGGETAENAPMLKSTLSGLAPGVNYEITVFFWDANGDVEDWNIRAGFSPGSLTLYANGVGTDASELGAVGAGRADALSFTTAPTIMVESNRIMYAGVVGAAAADGSGEVEVFLDDLPSAIGANNRTWYDGLGYREIQLPTSHVVSLEVDGDFVQEDGATLVLDIITPGILDRLDVTQSFTAGGTLQVSLAAGAPAPELGDTFQILNFASASGAFEVFDLPPLDTGLAWNVSDLLITGELAVVDDVDLDDDGDVDGMDFLLIQRNAPPLLPAWDNLYGAHLVTPTLTLADVVPEPANCVPLCLTLAAGALMRSPWNLLPLGCYGWRVL